MSAPSAAPWWPRRFSSQLAKSSTCFETRSSPASASRQQCVPSAFSGRSAATTASRNPGASPARSSMPTAQTALGTPRAFRVFRTSSRLADSMAPPPWRQKKPPMAMGSLPARWSARRPPASKPPMYMRSGAISSSSMRRLTRIMTCAQPALIVALSSAPACTRIVGYATTAPTAAHAASKAPSHVEELLTSTWHPAPLSPARCSMTTADVASSTATIESPSKNLSARPRPSSSPRPASVTPATAASAAGTMRRGADATTRCARLR
mmetsp:Transcript_15503/g.54083  ORF Transcript_15503/g.54083 Transcript_15503/m.54083 type:complete len:266 (-) Transcript_15503:14-811(-)